MGDWYARWRIPGISAAGVSFRMVSIFLLIASMSSFPINLLSSNSALGSLQVAHRFVPFFGFLWYLLRLIAIAKGNNSGWLWIFMLLDLRALLTDTSELSHHRSLQRQHFIAIYRTKQNDQQTGYRSWSMITTLWKFIGWYSRDIRCEMHSTWLFYLPISHSFYST